MRYTRSIHPNKETSGHDKPVGSTLPACIASSTAAKTSPHGYAFQYIPSYMMAVFTGRRSSLTADVAWHTVL